MQETTDQIKQARADIGLVKDQKVKAEREARDYRNKLLEADEQFKRTIQEERDKRKVLFKHN